MSHKKNHAVKESLTFAVRFRENEARALAAAAKTAGFSQVSAWLKWLARLAAAGKEAPRG